MNSERFDQDSLRFHNRILTGKYAHWCPEWDNMPIDESCPEFQVCTCTEKNRITVAELLTTAHELKDLITMTDYEKVKQPK